MRIGNTVVVFRVIGTNADIDVGGTIDVVPRKGDDIVVGELGPRTVVLVVHQYMGATPGIRIILSHPNPMSADADTDRA